MRVYYVVLFLLSVSQFSFGAIPEKEIVIVVPSYNNSAYYQENLDSIVQQDYTNWRLIYLDDCSSDGTADAVEQYIHEHALHEKISLIKNKRRCGALCNLYRAIHACDDNVIVITVDGDDRLAHSNVFNIINNAYQNPDIWLTYGHYIVHPSGAYGVCRPTPANVIANNSFREFRWVSSHLRTFYAWLFKQVKVQDLLHDGTFFLMTWDMAFGFPMREMAGTHFQFISDVLYVYRMDSPLNDFRVCRPRQRKLEKHIRKKQKYTPLAAPKNGYPDTVSAECAQLAIDSLEERGALDRLCEVVATLS